MTAPKLTLIKGTRDEHLQELYRFADAEVTDTRLMGVLGLHIHWIVTEFGGTRDFHQFYYYDYVELGLDFIESLYGNDPSLIKLKKKEFFGGLGANMKSLTEKEARWLANFFIDESRRLFPPLIPEAQNIDFVTKVPVSLSPEERDALNSKLCTALETDFGVVNYFLMRGFSRDFEAAGFLTAKDVPEGAADPVCESEVGELLRNSISVSDDGERPVYLCESLVEVGRGYILVFSEICVSGGKVVSAKVNSRMRISGDEAAMKLMREEYVTVYNFDDPSDSFDLDLDELTLGATESVYGAGELYMHFKPDNSHVEKPLYKLNDDVETMYFVCRLEDPDPQIVAASFSYEGIKAAESALERTFTDRPVIAGRYHFDDSLVFDFANSGYDDFTEYLMTLDLSGE